VNSGEEAKTWHTLSSVLEFLLKNQADQQSVMVVVGGGALSDVGGLAASLFKRGIRWVSVPTTLLAMVDAAWGGKTAINFGGVKNSVGVYHWPCHWIYDLGMLQTLTPRQRFDGWAEMLKHAIIGDTELFYNVMDFLGSEPQEAQLGAKSLPLPCADLIDRALQVKIRIVSEDPYEGDLRRLLNYGHTLAHAIEASSSLYSHGQAVWLGMFFELKLAVHHQLVAESESMLILDLLRLLAPFSELPSSGIILPDWDTVWNLMSQDKKIRFGQIQWSVPAGIGQGITGLEIPFDCLKELYEGWSANPWE
jgi:3-dehydroquinate synthase